MNWSDAIRSKTFLAHASWCLAGLCGLVLFYPYFFQEVLLHKQGIHLHDLLLQAIPAKDYSFAIFVLIHSTILIFFIRAMRYPVLLLTGIEAYLLMNVLRVAAMLLYTLEPPIGIIPLVDPFVSKVAYGSEVFNKDLFFSGHTATLVLLVLLENERLWKIIFIVVTFGVAVLLMMQHVHYTIDILAAPLAAWLAFFLGKRLTAALAKG